MQKLVEKYTWSEIVDESLRKLNKTKPLLKKRKNKEFKEWMLTKEISQYPFDYLMYARCFYIQDRLKDDYDHFTVVSGGEGEGKTTLAANISAIVSPTFNLNSFCFRMKQFINNLKYAKKGDSILLDEGNLFLFSRDAMGKDNKLMVKLFTIMRQKNVHVIICVPNFFTIDPYIRDHRVKTLFYIGHRGVYNGYTGLAIKLISEYGKKTKHIRSVRIPAGTFWSGNFKDQFPVINDITKESYLGYKKENSDIFINEIEKGIYEEEIDSNLMPVKKALKYLPISLSTAIHYINRNIIDGIKIGDLYFVRKDWLNKNRTSDKPII